MEMKVILLTLLFGSIFQIIKTELRVSNLIDKDKKEEQRLKDFTLPGGEHNHSTKTLQKGTLKEARTKTKYKKIQQNESNKHGEYTPLNVEDLSSSNKKGSLHELGQRSKNEIHGHKQKHKNSSQIKTNKTKTRKVSTTTGYRKNILEKNEIQVIPKDIAQNAEYEHQQHLIEMFTKLTKQLSSKNLNKDNTKSMYPTPEINRHRDNSNILYDNIDIVNTDEKDHILHETTANMLENLDEQEAKQLERWVKLNEEADRLVEDERNAKNNLPNTQLFHYSSTRHNKKSWPQKEVSLVAEPQPQNTALSAAQMTVDTVEAKESLNQASKMENETSGINRSLCNYCRNNGLCVFKPEPESFRCYCIYGYSGRTCEKRSVGKLYGCRNNTCFNGATCIEIGEKNFHCQCREGFHGRQCIEHNFIDWQW